MGEESPGHILDGLAFCYLPSDLGSLARFPQTQLDRRVSQHLIALSVYQPEKRIIDVQVQAPSRVLMLMATGLR